MTDLATLLHHAADSVDAAPGADVAPADLDRGRRAALRLRARRRATRGTGVATVAALALVMGVGTSSRGPSRANAATLVSYTGTQPAGYTVDAVPAGWSISSSDPSYLILSSPSSPTTTVTGTSGAPLSVDGDILVSWQNDAGPAEGATPVQVGPHRGLFNEFPDAGGVTGLQYDDASGHHIVLQLPPALHWSASQAAAFAEGIHVTSAAANTGG